jgi:hypothetical protein
MAKGHAASSSMQIKTLGNFIQENASPASRVRDTSNFEGPSAGVGINKFNRQSTSFNFLNSDIAKDRGRPNSLAKETTGSVYGGPIGEPN